MTSSEKNRDGPTSWPASISTSRRGRRSSGGLSLLVLDVLVGVLDHDDGRIHHRPDGDGDAAQAHDVAGQPDPPHRQQRQQHGQRQGDDRDQGAAEVEQEDDAHEADDEAFLDQLLAQRLHRMPDQLGAVIGDDQLDALRQRRLDLLLDRLLDTFCSTS